MDAMNEYGAMSVDVDGEPVNYQPVDHWLQRVGVIPSTSSPRLAVNNAPSPAAMPPASHSLDSPAMTDMVPAQYAAKMDRLTKKVNDLESTIYFLKEDIGELQQKKNQLNQELAGLSNAKSAIKTINQRLNSMQFGFSRLLDRIEVIEKSAGIEDAFRSTGRSIEFTNGDDDILSNPGNPLTVLSSGANSRGRNKHKRRAVDQGDRSNAAAAAPAPEFNVGTVAAAVGRSPADIAKMEELLALVVRQLAAMKLPRATEGSSDNGSTTAAQSSSSMPDGDIPMSNEEGAQGQEGQMTNL